MQVEDSYEGAMLRLQRLEQAGLIQAPQQTADDDFARMRDLEELATIACDENERLNRQLSEAESELSRAREELSRARVEIEGTRDELAHAHGQLTGARDQILSLQRVLEQDDNEVIRVERELSDARDQIASLQRIVHMLEESAAPEPRQHFQPPVEQIPDIDEDPLAAYSLATRKKSVWPFVTITLAVAGLGALLAARPWAQPTSIAAAVALPPPVAPLPPPVAAPPPPAPIVAPVVAPVAATIPKVEIPKAAVAPKPRKEVVRRHVAKPKKHVAKKEKPVAGKKEWTRTSDPLGGLNL